MITITFDDFDCYGEIMIHFIFDGQEIRKCHFSLTVDDFTTIINFLENCIKHTYCESVLGEEALSTKLIFDKQSDEKTAKLTFTYEDNSRPYSVFIETKQFVAEFYNKLMAILENEKNTCSKETHYYRQNPVKDYNDCKSSLIENFIK